VSSARGTLNQYRRQPVGQLADRAADGRHPGFDSGRPWRNDKAVTPQNRLRPSFEAYRRLSLQYETASGVLVKSAEVQLDRGIRRGRYGTVLAEQSTPRLSRPGSV
jgi:hypothetical protein